MDSKLNELKEKQTEIGDKISLLQATNKKKDEEAEEIRQLIAECRENLNRIKGIRPGSPCEGLDENENQEGNCEESQTPRQSGDSQNPRPCGESQKPRPSGESQKEIQSGESQKERPSGESQKERPCGESQKARPCGGQVASAAEGGPCKQKKKQKKGDKETLSCRVDLNKMKIRLRGPSEDLKKLDATELITLLEQFKCRELIINTGNETLKDPGEVRLVYVLHPGNVIMVAGIVLVAFLVNTDICHVESCTTAEQLVQVLYVGSTAFHYGMVLWMIFIRGYALRFGLNHDMYHLVDNLILPKYFTVCVLLSTLSVYSFLATHSISPCSSWPLEVIAQVTMVVTLFFVELLTICYIVPALIKLRRATDDYIFDDDDEAECDAPASYRKNVTKLGKLNWTLCLVNFLTLLLLGANIYFITSKLGSAAD